MEQAIESSPRTRRTRKEISTLLSKYKTSGLTVAAFCEQQQIHTSNFYKWVSRYPQKSKSKKTERSAFAKVRITSPENVLFAEVNGIRIYQVVSPSFLKELKG